MSLIDLHCDTISRLMDAPKGECLAVNQLSIDVEGMESAGTLAQFFACFVNAASFENKEVHTRGTEPISSEAWERAYLAVLAMADRLEQEQNDKIKVAHSAEEIETNSVDGVISAVKTVEEGGVINGNLSRIDELYNKGIRLITLTWNHPNCLGYPNSRDKSIMEKGLTELGCRTVERMNELGILVDVSHLSDGGFWDCIRISKTPVCASHSNARALCGHPRNLTDHMIRTLAENGGVAGLNFYPAFLTGRDEAVLDDIARHAVYMIRCGGEDVAAIGTDFDGFDNKARDGWIGHVREMEAVWDAMKKRGVTERQLDKIMSGNALRVIRETIR